MELAIAPLRERVRDSPGRQARSILAAAGDTDAVIRFQRLGQHLDIDADDDWVDWSPRNNCHSADCRPAIRERETDWNILFSTALFPFN